LRILFISGQDSVSNPMSYIAKELVDRGHNCNVLLTSKSEKDRIGFDRLSIPYTFVQDEVDFNFKKVSVIFIGESGIPKIIENTIQNLSIYIISLCFHGVFSKYGMSEAYLKSNLIFCYGPLYKKVQDKVGYPIDCIPINSPEYDRVYNKEISKHNKTVLFIDPNHNPSPGKGKLALAKSLIKTAVENPDYKIIIRPRIHFHELNADSKKNHLFYYIYSVVNGRMPKNMILMEDRIDLVEQILTVDIVCSLLTSAVYPAIIMRKPILILVDIDGSMPSDYSYQRSSFMYSHFGLYGENIISYNELYKKIRNVKSMPKDLSDEIFYDSNGNSAALIADYVEFIDKVIEPSMYLPKLDLDINNYKKKINDSINSVSLGYLKSINEHKALKLPIWQSIVQIEGIVFLGGEKYEAIYDNFFKKMRLFLKNNSEQNDASIFLKYAEYEKYVAIDKIISILKFDDNEVSKIIINYVIGQMRHDGMIEKLKSFPTNLWVPEVNYNIASFYDENQNYDEAINYYKKYIHEFSTGKIAKTNLYYNIYKKTFFILLQRLDIIGIVKIFSPSDILSIIFTFSRVKFKLFLGSLKLK